MLRLEWQVAAATDTGRRRSDNQDNYYISPDNRVFVVADGMGGELGGATASRLAVEAVEKLWKDKKPHSNDKDKIQQWLGESIANANKLVWDTSAKDPTVHGMGTTIVVAVQSDDNNLYVAHVGDSRAYLIREKKSSVLTQDHSVVMELLLQGKISLEQCRTSPFRNFITRCVGHNNKVEVDNTPTPINAEDCIILCTDGLSGVLSDDEIGEIADLCQTPEEICNKLVEETLLGGAPDNVTLVVIRYAPVESAKPQQRAVREDPAVR